MKKPINIYDVRASGSVIDIPPSVLDFKEYLGWRYWWTGWKACHDSEMVVCQWVAIHPNKPKGPHLYASYPGYQGHYFSWEKFDVSVYEDQVPISIWDTANERGRARLDSAMENARIRLFALIEKET